MLSNMKNSEIMELINEKQDEYPEIVSWILFGLNI